MGNISTIGALKCQRIILLCYYNYSNYIEESAWSGQMYLNKLTDYYKKIGFTEDDVRTDGINAVCLYPMN